MTTIQEKQSSVVAELNRRNLYAENKNDEGDVAVGVQVLDDVTERGEIETEGLPLIDIHISESDLDEDTEEICNDIEKNLLDYMDGELNDDLEEEEEFNETIKEILNFHKTQIRSNLEKRQ